MKESLAHALSGPISLAEDQWRERDVDRLHALAAAQVVNCTRTEREALLAAIGKSWIALCDGKRLDEREAVREGLVICLMWGRPRPTVKAADKAARWVIIERLHENCPTCRGKMEIPDTDRMSGRVFADGDGAVPMRVCPECNGTGKHRYSNQERIAGLEIEPGELHKYSRLLSEAALWLSQAESQCLRSTAQMLERWNK